jgi:hypothetical protein
MLINREKLSKYLNRLLAENQVRKESRKVIAICEVIAYVENMPSESPQFNIDDVINFLRSKPIIFKNTFGVERKLSADFVEGVYNCKETIIDMLCQEYSAKQPQEDKPDKRCGTCKYFDEDVVYNCKKGHNNIYDGGKYPMIERDDADCCPDWKAKEPENPKEKRRVWICEHCGKDVEFRDYKGYWHIDSKLAMCPEGLTYATPKPDSGR